MGCGKSLPNYADCPNLFLKTTDYLGEGNNSSPVFDYKGRYIDMLSGNTDINTSFEYGGIFDSNQKRLCGNNFSIR